MSSSKIKGINKKGQYKNTARYSLLNNSFRYLEKTAKKIA